MSTASPAGGTAATRAAPSLAQIAVASLGVMRGKVLADLAERHNPDVLVFDRVGRAWVWERALPMVGRPHGQHLGGRYQVQPFPP